MGPAEGPGSQAVGPRPAGGQESVEGAASAAPASMPAPPSGPQPSPFESVPLPEPEPARGLRAIAWFKRFAKLWGFLLFCIFVVYVFREVVLPFIFAVLVAYILAPLVDRLARLRVADDRYPRGLAVIVIYINLIAVLALFLGYFIPKLSGDFARLFREAPALFHRLNQDVLPRAGAWVDKNLGAGTLPAEAPEPTEAAAPREVIVEPLGGGKLRVDLTGLVLEVEQGPGGKLIIAAPQAGRARRRPRGQVGAIDQAVDRRAGQVDRDREPPRARVRPAIRRRGDHRSGAPGPRSDGGRVHPDRSAAPARLHPLAGSPDLPARLRSHRRRHRPWPVRRDPRSATHLHDQRLAHLRGPEAVRRQVPPCSWPGSRR